MPSDVKVLNLYQVYIALDLAVALIGLGCRTQSHRECDVCVFGRGLGAGLIVVAVRMEWKGFPSLAGALNTMEN